jgi:cell division septal protein FtsQ
MNNNLKAKRDEWQIRRVNLSKHKTFNKPFSKVVRNSPERITNRYAHTGSKTIAQNNFDYPKAAGIFIKLILAIVFCVMAYHFILKGIDFIYGLEIIKIKDIEIVGAVCLSESEIKKLVDFEIGDNIFSANLSELESKILEKKPEIKTIAIDRSFFDGGLSKIRIEILERAPVAFVKTQNGIKAIDDEIKEFNVRGQMKDLRLPIISYKTTFEAGEILDFIKNIKIINEDFLANIKEIKSIDGIRVLIISDGTMVYWGDEDVNLAKKINMFERIYGDAKMRLSKIDYIDMSVYNLGRAIVKSKS